MSFSWYAVRRKGKGCATEHVPGQTLERAKLPGAFIGGTAQIEVRELFGFDIRAGMEPDDLRALALLIRARATATHTCNCAYCGWTPPNLGDRTSAAEWIERADLFDALAANDWGMEGSY